MNLSDWRRRIDEIDKKLVELLTSARTAPSKSASSNKRPTSRSINPTAKTKSWRTPNALIPAR